VKRKKTSLVSEFLDALAEVIADRVATKMTEASKPAQPRMVPKWLPGSEKPARRRRGPAPRGEDARWAAQRVLRDSGFLTFGDPGYDEALKKHLEAQRGREGEDERRAQMSKAARLFERLMGPTADRRPSNRAPRRSSR
jgi:hypothetical protein